MIKRDLMGLNEGAYVLLFRQYSELFTKNVKSLTIALSLILISFISLAQSRQVKTDTIFSKLKLIEGQKINYEFQIGSLKNRATGNDSIKIIELEKKITDDEIARRLYLAFSEVMSDEEINDIYHFIRSSAFEKFFNQGETNDIITSKFIDIDLEINEIRNNINEIVEKSTKISEDILVDRENGFYATVDYNFYENENDIKLELNPSLTFKDILEVKKVYNRYNDRPEISITFTKDGAKKFYLLTKENIGKPVAIVIEKHIVSKPIVQSEIMGGKASITGDFSEEEIDKMIEIIQEK